MKTVNLKGLKKKHVSFCSPLHWQRWKDIILPIMCAQPLSHVQLFSTSWTVTRKAPLSMEFSRQECWSGCYFLFEGIFLTQGSNSCLWHLLHWQADSLPLWHLGSPIKPIPHSVRVVWWRGKTILHSCRLFSWLSHPSRAYNISCQKLVTF